MPTSELSDALNPYYAQPRSKPTHSTQASPPTSQQHVAATSGPPRPPSPPSPPLARTHPHSGGIHAVQELLRFLASTREAQEIERKRRIAWEQEQEAKYRFRQAEMERRMLEMQQEIAALKARVAFSSPGGAPVGHSILSHHAQLEYASFVSPSQQPTPRTSPTLSHPSTPVILSPGDPCVAGPSMHECATVGSPLLPAARFVNAHASSPLRQTRGCSTAGSDSEGEMDTDGRSAPGRSGVRRKNHHDRRCLTIQHAMRNYLLRVMVLDTDKDLPDSHVEGTTVGPDEPVRFVWDKTPRQSVHNGRMKERVLKNLKANRAMYKHVPDKDFGKKMLDAVFDQAFVTLRQKFKAQRDACAARAHKQREELKAQRARRTSRRKVKLGNRSEARNKTGAFEHVMFDGALQLECMSSEESEEESEGTTVLRVRGYGWRSARLQRFYDALDEASVQRPRRGAGRRERVRGAAKEGAVVLPRGVSGWMVSKRWARTYGAVPDGVVDAAGLGGLGEESA